MVRKKQLKRSMNPNDRRRYQLEITDKGKDVLNKLPEIIKKNRKISLSGISKKEQDTLKTILLKIKKNCAKHQKS